MSSNIELDPNREFVLIYKRKPVPFDINNTASVHRLITGTPQEIAEFIESNDVTPVGIYNKIADVEVEKTTKAIIKVI